MFSLDKRLRRQQETRRYSIHPTEAGWEVLEEHDSEVVRRINLQDWHRVERARRTIAVELDKLQRKGWSEVPS